MRALAFVALGALLAYTIYARRQSPPARAAGGEVAEALVRWSTYEAPGRVHVTFDSAPSPDVRDWLAALNGAGTETTWGGAAPPPTAVTVEPVADPARPVRVWAAAPSGARIVLRDALGGLDSATAGRTGARIVLPNLEGPVRAMVASTGGVAEASAALRDSLVLRPVLLLGQAGWEAKFVFAALEEHGWKVDARLAVAPSGDVRQGPAAVRVDTARYAAVIALDSVAGRYARQIIRYVQNGGGLLALGDGAALASLAPVLPAVVTGPPSLPGVFTDSIAPRNALSLAPLGRVKEGALVLETRTGQAGRADVIAAAAWRAGEGRVVQVGYHDSWRWRMNGPSDDPVRGHRAWWAALVSGVAYAPQVAQPVTQLLEPTPLASLVAALGRASPRPAAVAGVLDDPRLVPLLFGLLLAALFFEWASRRLRGAR